MDTLVIVYSTIGVICFVAAIVYDHFIKSRTITLTDFILYFAVISFVMWPILLFAVIVNGLKKFFDFCDTIVVLKPKDK